MKVFKLFLGVLFGGTIGFGIASYFSKKMMDIYEQKLEKENSMSRKHLDLFLMSNQWVRDLQNGKEIKEYLIEKGYRNIAIYGMSYAGETLLDGLLGSEINVAYGIDRGADGIYTDINVLKPTDNLDKVDAIIVTSISYFDEIYADLCDKIDCPILSLEDILYEM